MKTKTITTLLVCVALLGAVLFRASSQETAQPKNQAIQQSFEYASVRFMEDKTSIFWPDGSVENVMELAGKTKFQGTSEKYPKGTDYRMYWLTAAMNIMAKRGFELAHMHDHDLVMKRQVAQR